MAQKVLIAEDDRAVRESLEMALRMEGYEPIATANGQDALEQAAIDPPDIFIVDMMMPFVDGVDLCKKLRDDGDTTPILMLTARHEVRDRVRGLDAGADDYLVKPFALEELFARLRALRRRGDDTAADDEEQTVSVDDLVIDQSARTVSRGGIPIELTKTEFELLDLLVSNAGIVLEREVLYDRIWGFDFETSSKSLDVYIGYVRKKTELNGASRLIHTVRGVGYVARPS